MPKLGGRDNLSLSLCMGGPLHTEDGKPERIVIHMKEIIRELIDLLCNPLSGMQK